MLLAIGLLAVVASSSLADDFRVTNAFLKADDARMSGPCPLRVVFNGDITTNGPGIVRYTFIRSDGATGPVFTMAFRTAGRQRVNTDWTLGDDRALPDFAGWQAIRILYPNEMESNHETGSFSISCREEADDFRVTNAFLKADDARMSGPCPLRVVFNGDITTNGPGIVRYTFTRSDGATAPIFTLGFSRAGTQSVSTTWTLGGIGLPRVARWQAIKILSPNDMESSHETGSFSITCREETPLPSSGISVYTAQLRPLGVRSRRFRVGDTVVLRVENNTPDAIYYLIPIPFGSEIARGEGLVVQRLDGSDWVSAVNRAFIDEPVYHFIELRGEMNITRQWTDRFAVPGTYRVAFTYSNTADSGTYDRMPVRGDNITLYSETFEVMR